jgi:hypothetical protein
MTAENRTWAKTENNWDKLELRVDRETILLNQMNQARTRPR